MRTPARTPAAGGGNRIMQEAQNLRMLQQGQGPLLGGENPELHPSDFTGVTPRSAPSQTPNPLAAAAAAAGGATPSVHGGPSVAGASATPQLTGATPGRGGTSVAGISATPLLGATPGRGGGGLPSATPTPMRDALGLNDPDTFAAGAGGSSKREEAARLALQRNELRAGLSQLPAPRNEYQIVVPDMPGGWVGGWEGVLGGGLKNSCAARSCVAVLSSAVGQLELAGTGAGVSKLQLNALQQLALA
jgi:pre-mRNA-splicing factor CDC5/CEF1